jgi:hypothetical protein
MAQDSPRDVLDSQRKGPRVLKKGSRQPSVAPRRCKTVQERPKEAKNRTKTSPKRAPKSVFLKEGLWIAPQGQAAGGGSEPFNDLYRGIAP